VHWATARFVSGSGASAAVVSEDTKGNAADEGPRSAKLRTGTEKQLAPSEAHATAQPLAAYAMDADAHSISSMSRDSRPRLRFSLASEMFQWNIADDIAQLVSDDVRSSAAITLQSEGARQEMVKWKVRVIHVLYRHRGRVVPSSSDPPDEVPEELQQEASLRYGLTAEGTKTLRTAQFLTAIRNNWRLPDGSWGTHHTKLEAAEKELIQALPFFDSWIAGEYAVVRWKVRVVHALYKQRGREVPAIGARDKVPQYLHQEAPLRNVLTAEGAKTLKTGSFLKSIRKNWQMPDGSWGTPNTKLEATEKELIQALPFFDSWMVGNYAVTQWKVRVIYVLYKQRSREVPPESALDEIPEDLQQEAPLRRGLTVEGVKTLKTGEFLNSTRNNWPMPDGSMGSAPLTKLDAAEKELIQALPFFASWIVGDYAVIRWKVWVVHVLYKQRGREVPPQGVPPDEVPEDLQHKAPLRNGLTVEGAKTLKTGEFLRNVRNNWAKQDGSWSAPGTKLEAAEMRLIEALPFFDSWMAGNNYVVTQWKVRVVHVLYKQRGREVPSQRAPPDDVPAELQQEAPLRNGLTVEGAKTLHTGHFLNKIRNNWPMPGGSWGPAPNTKLEAAEKDLIQALPFFDSWIAGRYAVVVWKVRVMHVLYNQRGRTCPGRYAPPDGVPEDLQQQAPLRSALTAEGAKTLHAGQLLHEVRNNWQLPDGSWGAPNTKLEAAEMRLIESLPFFDSFIASDYAVLQWKVRVVHLLYQYKGREVPYDTVIDEIPDELQQVAPLRNGLTAEGAKTLRTGTFLGCIRNNWPMPDGSWGPAHTKLAPAEKELIQALPFFDSWIAGDYAVLQWKVRVIHVLYKHRGREIPTNTAPDQVPEDLQREAPLRRGLTAEGAQTLKTKYFLRAIRNNWPLSDGSWARTPNTKLEATEMQLIEAVPFAKEWLEGRLRVADMEAQGIKAPWKQREVEAPTDEAAMPAPAQRSKRKAERGPDEAAPPARKSRKPVKPPAAARACRASDVVQTEATKLAEDLKEPEFALTAKGEPKITKSAEKRLQKLGYDVATFTALHQEWKDVNVQLFVSMCDLNKPTLFLDHWSDVEKTRLRTLEALIEAGAPPALCHCANPDKAICRRLQERGARAVQGTFEESLAADFGSTDFGAVYADFCYGSHEKVRDALALLLDREGVAKPSVLVFTMTCRGSGALVERKDALHDFMKRHGYDVAVDGQHQSSWRLFRSCGVATGFYRLT